MKIMKALKKIMASVLSVAAALVLCLCLFVTFTTGGLLPGFLKIGAYAVESDEYGGVMPQGSVALVDKGSAIEKGDIVVFLSQGGYSFGTVLSREEGWVSLSSMGQSADFTLEVIQGRVFYRINGLGSAAVFLRDNRMAVVAVIAAAALGVIIWLASLPARRRRKEVKELIELFEYYGRKYDLEEEGIDY